MMPLCKYYLDGSCTKGKDCDFYHPKVCKYHKEGKCNKGSACQDYHVNPNAEKKAATRTDWSKKKKPSNKANVSLARVMMVAVCASAAFPKAAGCMRNASTSTTSSGEDDGFASREGSASSTTWRATTTMLTSMWKATPSVQSPSSSLPSSASREGSGSYRVYETPSAAPSKATPSIGEDYDDIRMHIRFPAWLRKIAAEQEKKPRSKYREARRVRTEEVYFPSAEMIRLCEVRAREEAFRQHTSLVKMGRRPDISFKRFFTRWKNESCAAAASSEGRQFIIDTGASLHCIGAELLTDEERKTMRLLARPQRMDTASGEVVATHEVTVYVRELGISVSALVMPDSPPLLSVGLLVKDLDMAFAFDHRGAVLTRKSGVRVNCRDQQNVPIITPCKGIYKKDATKKTPSTSIDVPAEEVPEPPVREEVPEPPTGEASVRRRRGAKKKENKW